MPLFQAYTQLINGEVHELVLKPLVSRAMARQAVAAAKVAVLEIGERALTHCTLKTTRNAYRASLGQNCIWYERVKS